MTLIRARDFKWLSKPERYILQEHKVILETEPFTNLGKKKEGSRAAELVLDSRDSFRFTVKVEFDYQKPFDQCGILLYQKDKKIAVCGAKLHNDAVDELECVVFHKGRGDRSSRSIGTAIRSLYYRVWYRSGHVRIQYSFNGNVYSDVREFWLPDSVKKLKAGIYACSPGDSSFNCTFSHMDIS